MVGPERLFAGIEHAAIDSQRLRVAAPVALENSEATEAIDGVGVVGSESAAADGERPEQAPAGFDGPVTVVQRAAERMQYAGGFNGPAAMSLAQNHERFLEQRNGILTQAGAQKGDVMEENGRRRRVRRTAGQGERALIEGFRLGGIEFVVENGQVVQRLADRQVDGTVDLLVEAQSQLEEWFRGAELAAGGEVVTGAGWNPTRGCVDDGSGLDVWNERQLVGSRRSHWVHWEKPGRGKRGRRC